MDDVWWWKMFDSNRLFEWYILSDLVYKNIYIFWYLNLYFYGILFYGNFMLIFDKLIFEIKLGNIIWDLLKFKLFLMFVNKILNRNFY